MKILPHMTGPIFTGTVFAAPLLAAPLFAAAALVSAPALAQAPAAAPAHAQVAELAAPASMPKASGKDVIWRCAGSTCTAPKSDRRANINCATLVKQVGKVTRFTTAGEDMDAASLERCNSFAR